jgi:hypothetical protein
MYFCCHKFHKFHGSKGIFINYLHLKEMKSEKAQYSKLVNFRDNYLRFILYPLPFHLANTLIEVLKG